MLRATYFYVNELHIFYVIKLSIFYVKELHIFYVNDLHIVYVYNCYIFFYNILLFHCIKFNIIIIHISTEHKMIRIYMEYLEDNQESGFHELPPYAKGGRNMKYLVS